MFKACVSLALLVAPITALPAASHNAPLMLRGAWRVGPVVDPTRQPLPADVAAQLAKARLPKPGDTVRGKGRDLCVGSDGCDEVIWTDSSFASSQYGDSYRIKLGLPSAARLYEGHTSNRFVVYTLVSQLDRTLLALFPLCQDRYRASGCRTTFLRWTPASPDARMESVHR